MIRDISNLLHKAPELTPLILLIGSATTSATAFMSFKLINVLSIRNNN